MNDIDDVGKNCELMGIDDNSEEEIQRFYRKTLRNKQDKGVKIIG